MKGLVFRQSHMIRGDYNSGSSFERRGKVIAQALLYYLIEGGSVRMYK